MSQYSMPKRAEEIEHDLALRGRRFVQSDRYVLVFALIVCSLVATSFIGRGVWGLVLSLGFLSATLLVTLSTSDAGPKTLATARIAVVACVAGILVAELFDYTGVARVALLITLLVLSTVTPVVIARRLWRHPVVNVNTIAGAADIYLLIGFFYTTLYSVIGMTQAGIAEAINAAHMAQGAAAPAFFYASRPVGPSDFLFFSFTTLTTVGYGDLVPKTSLARLLANTEAVIGQLYLVTVLAIIVSNIGRFRGSQSESSADEPEEDG